MDKDNGIWCMIEILEFSNAKILKVGNSGGGYCLYPLTILNWVNLLGKMRKSPLQAFGYSEPLMICWNFFQFFNAMQTSNNDLMYF